MRIFIFLSIIFCSCSGSVEHKSSLVKASPEKPKPDTTYSLRKEDIKSIEEETLCAYGVFERTVCFGKYCATQIGRGKNDTILGYRFSCTGGEPYLPYYYKSDSETIVLQRGCGTACGAIEIYSITTNKIIYRGEFENPISLDIHQKLIAINDTGSTNIIVMNYITGDSTRYAIPFQRGISGFDQYDGKFHGKELKVWDEDRKHKIKLRLK